MNFARAAARAAYFLLRFYRQPQPRAPSRAKPKGGDGRHTTAHYSGAGSGLTPFSALSSNAAENYSLL